MIETGRHSEDTEVIQAYKNSKSGEWRSLELVRFINSITAENQNNCSVPQIFFTNTNKFDNFLGFLSRANIFLLHIESALKAAQFCF